MRTLDIGKKAQKSIQKLTEEAWERIFQKFDKLLENPTMRGAIQLQGQKEKRIYWRVRVGTTELVIASNQKR